MQKGSIRVQTENIFPIIKKFLYSDHDIFIRELVSNAVDATQKLKALSSMGEAKGDLGDLTIDIQLDTEKKTITISDKGLGMTAEEVDKFLNQVAFSGAEEFLNKYKGQSEANIIGHFGLGFYSSFMVSERVEVITKSYKEEAQAVRWECDGSPEFTLENADKPARGTDIILHINEESAEFLDAGRIGEILKKFCRFLPVPIQFEGKSVNNTSPAWTKKPSELTPKDYQDFYKELYPFGDAPLFWIHLNVDYPFNLTGILYFPKIKQSYEMQKDKIQLYSNQVFVTDEVKDIVPEFLMLLHGVIDSPDIPLNVSRSYLQGDPNVKKIGNHITKKVADKLEEIFSKERAEFEEKWESLGIFVKYGMMTDDKFLDKAAKFHIMEAVSGDKEGVKAAAEEMSGGVAGGTTEGVSGSKEDAKGAGEEPSAGVAGGTSEDVSGSKEDAKGAGEDPAGGKEDMKDEGEGTRGGKKDTKRSKFYTLEEYRSGAEALQKNKEGKLVILYTSNPVQQDSYIQQALAKGYIVVKLETIIDAAWINQMEQKWADTHFTRVDADIADNLVDKTEGGETILSTEEEDRLKALFDRQVADLHVTVEIKGLSPEAPPVVATRPEFMRRMKDMAAVSGPMGSFYASMPDEVTMTLNGNHPIYQAILKQQDKGKQEKLAHNLADLALLSQGLLKGNNLTGFIHRSVELMTGEPKSKIILEV